MLVLSRRVNEKVIFPTLGISIEVRRIIGKRVQLAIAAPADIPILRHELLERQVCPDVNRECQESAWSI
jgi:carbon storage regulator CsrA